LTLKVNGLIFQYAKLLKLFTRSSWRVCFKKKHIFPA